MNTTRWDYWNREGKPKSDTPWLVAREGDDNLEAAMVDELFVVQPDQEGRYPIGSYHHNVHFAWSAATFEGRSAAALQAARKLREKVYLQRPLPDIQKSSMTQLYASIPVSSRASVPRGNRGRRTTSRSVS